MKTTQNQKDETIALLVKALKGYRKALIESVGDPSMTWEMEEADKFAKKALKAAEKPAPRHEERKARGD